MKTGVLLSIREKSTRFPGKVLKVMHGQTITEHLIDRLKMAKLVDTIIIATSDDPRDDVFVPMAKGKNISIFRGSRQDKLKRYLDAADAFGLDAVIIIDGDDNLCFPEFVDKTADLLRNGQYDGIFWKGLPIGAASSGLTAGALKKVMALKAENDTEVWGGYFIGSGYFNVLITDVEEPFNHPDIRMTLDYEEDFDFFKAVFDELYPVNPLFSSSDVMNLLVHRKPHLNEINREAQAKFEDHLTKAAPVRFK
ncbi:MAG: hypothetical protein HQK96_03170 [Nitrospirae bacterium]|nr:hypothetical protein [Nitrospirota bacterium]